MGIMLLTGGLLTAAFITDITKRKIPNMLCAAGFLAGIGFHAFISGGTGIGYALLGALLGFAPLLILYMIRAVGAGDVKLFAAIGALSGGEFVLQSLMYALIYAAVIGCLILFWRGEWKSRGGPIYTMLMGILIWKRLKPLDTYRKSAHHIRFPFMWAVMPAAATVFWQFS